MRGGVEIRGPHPADAADISALLGQIGRPVAAHELAARLERLGGCVLVATDYSGRVIGVIVLAWHGLLQAARGAAYVSLLVVDADQRRRGVGRMLVRAGAQAARAAGCDTLHVAGAGAGDFLRTLGFAAGPVCFNRTLRKKEKE